jgi:hypothetical protein
MNECCCRAPDPLIWTDGRGQTGRFLIASCAYARLACIGTTRRNVAMRGRYGPGGGPFDLEGSGFRANFKALTSRTTVPASLVRGASNAVLVKY